MCGIVWFKVLVDWNLIFDFVVWFLLFKLFDMFDVICWIDICCVVEGNVLVYCDSYYLIFIYMWMMISEFGW